MKRACQLITGIAPGTRFRPAFHLLTAPGGIATVPVFRSVCHFRHWPGGAGAIESAAG
jgi:hypothetical protein